MPSTQVHEFSNGVKVYDHHLIDLQRERYQEHNVHEAEEEEIFVRCIEDLPSKATFVNVGAAIGYYGILAARLRPDLKIVAYEPLRLHRRRMKENMRLNGISPGAIQIMAEGLSASEGEAQFMIQDFSSMVVGDAKPTRGPVQRLLERWRNNRIATIGLGRVIERIGGRIDLLQMDIQGLELPVLRAAEQSLSEGSITRLLIGTHSAAIHEDLSGLLRRCGYSIEQDIPSPENQPDGILLAGYNHRTEAD